MASIFAYTSINYAGHVLESSSGLPQYRTSPGRLWYRNDLFGYLVFIRRICQTTWTYSLDHQSPVMPIYLFARLKIN
jgi:hypothetical protein